MMETKKHVDLTFLKEMSNGSNEFILQMIDVFMQQTPEALDNMQLHLKNQDWKALAATVHKIKPSFGFMGIKSVQDTVAELEAKSAKGENTEEYAAMIEKISQVCKDSMAELHVVKTDFQS